MYSARAFESELARELGLRLGHYNSRDDEAVMSALNIVKTELSNQFEMDIETRLGGSVLKDTYVEGLSDVDALIILQGANASELNPTNVRKAAASCLRACFGLQSVTDGTLAVTLRISELELQLLPSVQQGDSLKIGSTDGNEWSKIQPHLFVERLMHGNFLTSGKLIPTIKLAKAIIATLPRSRQLSGYHIEALAVSIFNEYCGRKDPKDMLRFLFRSMPHAILIAREDVTGQSVYLDDYLDRAKSRRRITADAIHRIGRRIKHADETRSIELWRGLFLQT